MGKLYTEEQMIGAVHWAVGVMDRNEEIDKKDIIRHINTLTPVSIANNDHELIEECKLAFSLLCEAWDSCQTGIMRNSLTKDIYELKERITLYSISLEQKPVVPSDPSAVNFPLYKQVYVKIDQEDLEKVSKYNWRMGTEYPETKMSNGRINKSIPMHRIIMDATEGQIIDHINRDRFDNRKSNLRVVTPLQNQWNKVVQGNNKSGFPGVSFESKYGKWRAKINVNHKPIHLGYFDSKEDAISARIDGEKTYWGEYAPKRGNNE